MKLLPCQLQTAQEIVTGIYDAMNIAIIIRVCQECHEMLGVIDGHGVYGVSHGYCPPCAKDARIRAGIGG